LRVGLWPKVGSRWPGVVLDPRLPRVSSADLPQIFRGSSAVETKQIFDDLVATVVSTMVATMVARHHGGHQELHSIQF